MTTNVRVYASMGRADPTHRALADIIGGLRAWRLWSTMGWYDIRQRYRRSMLGPFWLTISMGIMICALGLIYSTLFGMKIDEYLPFLSLGFVVWGLISGLVNDSCAAFYTVEGLIKQVPIPLTAHVLRVIWRNVIIFAHNIVIFVAVAVIFAAWPGATALLAIPGLLLLLYNALWFALLVGMICTRFRDVPQIVASLIQVVFFITPILWRPATLVDYNFIVDWNPFYHFLELVRAPLLGQVPDLLSWLVALGISIAGSMIAFLFLVRFRSRVAYWL